MKNICNICGANYEYKNGKWVCPACGAYKEEELSNEEVTLLYTASQKLRLNAFDDAEEAYRDIVRKYPENSEGYWGLLLAKYGIKYEQDYDGKMIPTCYATSYESVKDDKNYKRALDLATPENRKYYIEQAEKIEKIRKEWVEKASKEPPYDIFISYKATELENDVKQTQDSIDAYELYTHITALGYRVFFSRESLKSKTGEKFEPYIFNALNTAQVMIIYGSKVEYIESTWVKNEWSRYYKRIKSGQKQKNSIVVVYKDFNPSKLPRPLPSVQNINRESLTFLQDLDSYVARVLKAAHTVVPRIERKEIKNRIAKTSLSVAKLDVVEVIEINGATSKSIKREKIAKREIGTYSVPKLTANAEKLIKIAYAYLESGNFTDADKSFDSFLLNNRQNGNALLGKMLAQAKCKNIAEFDKTGVINFRNLQLLNDVLAYAEKSDAEKVLSALSKEIKRLFSEKRYDESKELLEQINSIDNETVSELREFIFQNSLPLLNEISNIQYFIDAVLVYEQDEVGYVNKLHTIFENCINQKAFSLADKYHKILLDYDAVSLQTQIGGLQLKYKATNLDGVFLYCQEHNEFGTIEKVLNNVDEQGAEALLLAFASQAIKCLKNKLYKDSLAWCSIFSKYRFEAREANLKDIAEICINTPDKGIEELFIKVITVLSNGDVKLYANYYYLFAKSARKSGQFTLAIHCYEKAIKYGGDDIRYYAGKLYAELKYDSDKKIRDCILNLSDTETLETILALYENDEKRISFLDWLITASLYCVKEKLLVQDRIFTIFETLLSFIPQQYNDKLNLYVNEMAQNCLINGAFEYAERYYAMSIGLNADDHTAYWGLLLAKLKCKSDEQLIKQKEVVTEFQEFQNALLASASNSSAMAHYIDLQNKQKAWLEEQEIKQVKAQKRKRRIKIASVALSLLILLCGIITGGVYWYKSENQLKFEKVEGGYAIDSGLFYHSTASGVFEIPSTYKGESVVRINSGAFKNFDKVTEFIIPESIQTINDKAFADCDGITEIYIPNTVKYMGANAFENCKNLNLIAVCDREEVPTVWNTNWNNNCIAQVEFSLLIRLSANGGTLSQTELYVIYEKTFTLPIPVKPGYTFDGWYRDDEKLTDGTGKSLSTWNFNNGGTLTARYAANENKIIFNGNGATSGSMEDQKIYTDDSALLFANEYEKEGYTFAGWTTVANLNVIEYFDNDLFKMGADKSYTLYAVWAPNENTLYFDGNGATSGSMDFQNIYTDESVTLNENNFKRIGYNFVGWSTTVNGSIIYSDKSNYTMGTESVYTIYAVWKPIEYSITFELNGGTENDNFETYNIETETFTLNIPVRAGYTFAGWTGEELTSVQRTVTIEKGSIGNKMYSANWTANLNTITFHANGGEGEMPQQKIATDSTVQLISNNYFREGYIFIGWATTPNGERSYAENEFYTMDSENNYDLFALWSQGSLLNDFQYSGDEEISIVKYIGTDSLVVIPEFIDNKPVTGIANGAFADNEDIVEVCFPNSLKTIGDSAFSGCSSLKYITIPNNVTTIGWSAFYNCSSIKYVTLGEGIVSIGDYALCRCTEIVTINFNAIECGGLGFTNSAFSYAGQNGNGITVNIGKNVKVIPDYLFGHMAGFDPNYTQPDYPQPAKIISITFPSDAVCESIGYSAFAYSSYLKSIILPESIKSIGGFAFYRSGINDILIPANVTHIDLLAFAYCSNLTTISVDSKNETYFSTKNCIIETASKTLIRGCGNGFIPNDGSVTSIGENAFCGIIDLISLEIPDCIISIGGGAFAGCYNLKSVVIPEGITSISDGMFSGCTSLSNIIIPNSVKSIGSQSFYMCYGLTSIKFSNSVTSIGTMAFGWCSNLRTIIIPESVIYIGSYAFGGWLASTDIYVEASFKPIGWADDWAQSSHTVIWGYIEENKQYEQSTEN